MTDYTQVDSAQAAVNAEQERDQISLLDLLIAMAKHKRLILGLPLAAALIALGYSLWLPDTYTPSTKLLPPQQNQSAASAILSSLGSLGALAGGGRGANEIYLAMLQSRTIHDRLVDRGLISGDSNSWFARTRRDVMTFTSGRDGLITIEVTATDPQRATRLANAYVEELVRFTQVLAVTEASKRRLFFEQQFEQAKENLAKVEVVARQALTQGGLASVDEQGRATITAIASLRGQITVKEVQIGAMHAYAAPGNPDLYQAQQELASMRRELAKLEGTAGERNVTSRRPIDSSGIETLHLLRDRKYHETIYELLAKQYEIAKLDEAKEASVIQVMDPAIVPTANSGPKRGMIVFLSALAALLVAIVLAFISESLAGASEHPRQAARLQALRRYLAWR